jgi:p-hydroxybenzoate 3-monooxygenase
LGILANVAPSSSELIYALHNSGFALHSMRSPEVSRFYLQIDPSDTIQHWPDDRVWEALATRLEVPGWSLRTGQITDKTTVPLRSYVAPTFAFQRLFLVGDAAHIVPPTGAKGLNAAIADVRLLATAFADHYAGADDSLAGYAAAAMAHQWRVQQFSQGMTELLHRPTNEFAYRNQLGRLDYLSRSPHAQRSFAEQYTGEAFQPMDAEFTPSGNTNTTRPHKIARILHR